MPVHDFLTTYKVYKVANVAKDMIDQKHFCDMKNQMKFKLLVIGVDMQACTASSTILDVHYVPGTSCL